MDMLKRLNVTQLAQLSGIGRSSLSRKMSGQTRITNREALDLASILGCSVAELLDWIDTRSKCA